MERKFNYSGLVIGMTILGLICLFSLCYVVATSKSDFTTVIGVLAIILLLYPLINAPVSVIQTNDGVRLNRFLTRKMYKSIDYDIKEVSEIDFSGSIRVLGSSGYFGYIGLFWKKGFGFFQLVQTESSHKFLEIKNKKNNHKVYIAI